MGVEDCWVVGVSAVLTIRRLIGERVAVSTSIALVGRVEIVLQLSVSMSVF